MQIRLDRQVALVTGGGSGIGEAASRLLAAAGAHVVVADISSAKAEQVAQSIREQSGLADAQGINVADDRSVQAGVERVLSERKRIDVLVNSAGVMRRTSIEDITSEDWDEVIGINVKGTFFVSRAVLPAMKQQGKGRIINVASNAGKTGVVVSGCHYAASKAAVISLTLSFARQLAEAGITVNAVSPGPTRTPGMDDLSPAQLARLRETVPMKRLGTPGEIGNAILFLASNLSDFITGEILDVDGGLTMD